MDNEAQLIEVTLESFKFVFEITKENIEIMKKAVSLFRAAADTAAKPVKMAAKVPSMLTYSKSSGKTNRKNFNLKAGAGTMFTLEEKYIKEFEKAAKKSGVLYVKMGKFNKESDKAHLLIPAQSSGIVSGIMSTILEKEISKIKRQSKREADSLDLPKQEKKEKYEQAVSDRIKALESRNRIESVAEYASEQKFDSLNMDEFAAEIRKVYPDASVGFNNSPEMAEKVSKNVEEIKEALRNNIYGGKVNNPEMIYIEFPEKNIIEQSEKNITLLSPDGKCGVKIPKEFLVKSEKDSYIAVLHRKSLIDVKYDDNTVKSIKAQEVKKIMKEPEHKYSSQFTELFAKNRNDVVQRARLH